MASEPISLLMAELMTIRMTETAMVTDSVISSLENRLADKTAELEAVRARVLWLLSGSWMPNPDAIRDALFPFD